MSENKDEFDSLKALLALKRHEVPPPGYFEDFSGQVIARLKAGEARHRASWKEQAAGEASWLLRFMRFFEAKPAIAGAMAAALCVLLFIGIIYSGPNDSAMESVGISTSPGTAAASTPVNAAQASPQLLASVANAASSGGLAVATNYSLQPVSIMFGGQPDPFTKPVSFSTGGN
jgi:hypothetical protein